MGMGHLRRDLKEVREGVRRVSGAESSRQREKPGSNLLECLRSLEEDCGLEQSGSGAWGGDKV